jgi:hypothetical protein
VVDVIPLLQRFRRLQFRPDARPVAMTTTDSLAFELRRRFGQHLFELSSS